MHPGAAIPVFAVLATQLTVWAGSEDHDQPVNASDMNDEAHQQGTGQLTEWQRVQISSTSSLFRGFR
jgi:hypothetical protein